MKNWLNNKIITKTIDGHDVRFRRIPVGTLQKFRFLADDVSKALGMLFKDTSHDVKVEQVSTPSDKTAEDGTPFMSTQYIQEAAEPQNIQLRKIQLEEGIKGIIRAMTADESLEVLAEIIVKSAFEEFSEGDVAKIKEEMDLATMIEFLKGAFEASAGDYSGLGKSLFQKANIQELLEKTTK